MGEPRAIGGSRHIALVAHDHMKGELAGWAEHNRAVLAQHVVYATGTTGGILADRLAIPVHRFLSGPVAATSRSSPASPRA